MSHRTRLPRLTGILGTVLVLVTTLTTVAPARAAGGNLLMFAPDEEPSATFGANEIIRIDGSIAFKDDCPEGGHNDWVYPATDVYIVPAGSVTGGGKLTDVGGLRPNTIVAGASVFTDEVIGVTAPTGDVDEGSFDVVYDTCQDGTYDPGVDTIFADAITVALPDILPLANQAIYEMKGEALVEYVSWLATRFAMDKLFDQADKAIKLQCDLGNPIGCAMKKLDYFDGIKKNFLQLLLSEANHYLAIALDPPDAAFDQVTTVGAISQPSDHTDAPVSNATSDALRPLAAEAALNDALLHAVERYQGAVAAGNGAWALEHAREAQNLSGLLAQATGASSAALTSLRDALSADPDIAQALSLGTAFTGRVWSSGFTADERRALLNQGMSRTDVANLETDIRNGGGSSITLSDLLSKLDDAVAAHANTGAAASAESTDWADAIAQIQADPSIVSAGPGASAGGPYTASEGSAITLNGSAAGPIDAAAWDLDADGSFDDASGLTPSASIATAGAHLIGLRTTKDGRASVAYAIVTVADTAHAPVLASPSPATRSASVMVGSTAAFSIAASDPDGDPLTFGWSVDGSDAKGSTNAFAYTPTLANVGVHSVQVTASDGTAGGGSTRRSWDVVVRAPDADADGWTATTDCDDTDAGVHPTATEILGNHLDDDCDPGTPDAPPGGLTGSIQSWGANQNGNVGTGSFVPTLVDHPVAVPGYDNVIQIKSSGRVSYAVLDNGEVRGWGTNLTGELGTGTCCSAVATPVSPLTVGGGAGHLTGVTQISANGGNIHVVGRRVDGTVISWGDNTQHQLGDGSAVNYRPYPVETLSAAGGAPLSGVTAVEAGYGESYALMDDGTVKAWGQIRCDGGSSIRVETYPITLGLLGGNVKQVSSGNQFTLFLKKDGTVLECGHVQPVAGRPVTYADMYVPTPVTGFGPGSGVIDIAAGYEGGLALKSDGTVWTWGQNNNGELSVVGAPGGTGVPAPVQVPLPPGPPVVDVDQSNACTGLALRADGSVLAWGCDFFQQVGDGPGGDGIQEIPQVLSMPGFGGVAVSNSVWNGMTLVRPVDDTSWARPATWVKASVADVTVGETAGGTFDVSISNALPQDVTVDWAIKPGTAGADDVDLASGTATIPAGTTSVQVPLPIHDDALDEEDETFSIVLTGASNGIQLDRSQAAGTILDDDAAPTISVAPAGVDEGDTALTDVPVHVHLSAASSHPVSAAYTTADGTASAPGDYAASSGTVVVPAGATDAVVHLAARGDTTPEPDKAFAVTLSNPQDATLGDASADVSIHDDDALVLNVTSPEVVEGNSGTTPATFTVALAPAPPTGTTVTIGYSVEGLSAAVPGDAAAATGTLTFAPGDGPKQVTVDVIGDTDVEGQEAFRLAFGTPDVSDGRAVLAGDNPPAIIVDDDTVAAPPPPANEPPSVDAGVPAAGAEGSAIAIDGTASDPDGDALTSGWSYQPGPGVDAGATCTFADPTAVDTTIACTDDGTYTATLQADDGHGHVVAGDVTVTVANANPSVTITAPAQSSTFEVGAQVGIKAALADAGANDAEACSVDWGDGTTSGGTLANGTCTAVHAYQAVSAPLITVTATDDDGGTGSAELILVVTSAVTTVSGGGWISDGTAKVSFGFVAESNATGYDGEVQVIAAGHRFHGKVVSSLAGKRPAATFSGTGRWDGVDGFTYTVSVQDLRNGGDRKGNPDTISIEIRDAGGTLVYAAAGPLGGGNIKVG